MPPNMWGWGWGRKSLQACVLLCLEDVPHPSPRPPGRLFPITLPDLPPWHVSRTSVYVTIPPRGSSS